MKVKKEDKKVVEALKRFHNIKEAASSLGVSRKTIYNRIASIRRRWKDARAFINWCLAQCKDDEWLEERLSPKVKLSRIPEKEMLPEEEPEEEEW